MHTIEPFDRWENLYLSEEDKRSPFYQNEKNFTQYSDTIYGYYIHPAWDYIGSETLYIRVLYANYEHSFVIIEMIGEWNDTLHNDIMHLKRNILDEFLSVGIRQFILIGENIFNFHGSDDCYYEEWFEEVEEGWIVACNFREHVTEEWQNYGIDFYINFGGSLDISNWRTLHPLVLFKVVNDRVLKRLT